VTVSLATLARYGWGTPTVTVNGVDHRLDWSVHSLTIEDGEVARSIPNWRLARMLGHWPVHEVVRREVARC
jgi:hypothetical protein